MKLLLKGAELLHIAKCENAHQLALKTKKSYPSIEKYVNRPGEISSLDVELLAAILIDGAGLTKEQVLALKIGDLFDLTLENKIASQI